MLIMLLLMADIHFHNWCTGNGQPTLMLFYEEGNGRLKAYVSISYIGVISS